MAYTEKEIAAFRKKDLLNSRMSALKAASLLYEGAGCDLGHPVDTVKADADKFFEWLQQDQDKSNASFPQQHRNSGTIPEPTLAQKKVLDAICKTMTEKQYNSFDHVTDIYWCVLKWAKEVHNVDYYPENMSSVDKFIKWLNKGENNVK